MSAFASARGGLPEDYAVDPERAARGSTPVPGGGLPRRGQGEEPQLRQGPRLRDLGAGAVTRSASFEDHFSEIAAAYAAHRPSSPAALVDFLARLAPETRLAWDAGSGSGQLSVLLAGPFDRVVATDASAEQIARAAPHPKVEYRCAPAGVSGLPARVVDLATAAQAAHWFDLPAYYAEVRRVTRPGGIVALISYGVVMAGADLGAGIPPFFPGGLASYWPPPRRPVDDGYRSLLFSFAGAGPPPPPIPPPLRPPGLVGDI